LAILPAEIESKMTMSTNVSDEMAKHGITKKTTDQFYFGEYRYSNLKDAIAQAKRVAGKTETQDVSEAT